MMLIYSMIGWIVWILFVLVGARTDEWAVTSYEDAVTTVLFLFGGFIWSTWLWLPTFLYITINRKWHDVVVEDDAVQDQE